MKKHPLEAELPEQEVNVIDSKNISEWKGMLGEFESLTSKNPEPEKVKPELLKLKEKAQTSTSLTYRQIDGIISRCDNYLNGTYGKDPIKEAYIKSQNKSTAATEK